MSNGAMLLLLECFCIFVQIPVTCLEIAYAVHQCAHFTHAPKDSHAKAVKRILNCLNGTKDQGIILHTSRQLTIDCFIDADFAGQGNA